MERAAHPAAAPAPHPAAAPTPAPAAAFDCVPVVYRSPLADAAAAAAAAADQGLTVAHFSAQPEPLPTQNTP